MIDDGSQPGGIRNFEDKSFERSDRSSLLSSARTELATDSVESEVPLEISLNVEKNNKEDYDIVQVDGSDKPKKTILEIERLSNKNERVPSPAPVSNINIDKYLFSDNDDDGVDDTETASTFNINMYFATEEKNNGNNETDEIAEEDSTLPVIVSKEDIRLENKDFDSDQKEGVSSSPFLEVNSELTVNLSTGNECEKVESEVDNEDQPSNNASSNGSTEDLNLAFVSHDLEETRVEKEKKSNSKDIDLQGETEDASKLCEEDKEKEIRKSVEDFYESILSEESSQGNTSDGLPPDATFGQPIGLSASYDNEDDEPAASPTENKKRKEGWLVRVESFSTPATCTPQIKVIGEDVNKDEEDKTRIEGDNDGEQSPAPVPKQRKKHKKKKKRQKSVDIVEAEGDSSNDVLPAVVDSNYSDSSPAVSPSKTLDHSDIPKQFLDASTTLGSGSLSDLSDVEHEVLEDGTTVSKKRSGSKKKNKEGCKTQ